MDTMVLLPVIFFFFFSSSSHLLFFTAILYHCICLCVKSNITKVLRQQLSKLTSFRHIFKKQYSVACSRLQNCGNPTKYIYRLHKWKALMPVHLQKMRMARIFQQPMQLVFVFVFLVSTITMHYLCDFL